MSPVIFPLASEGGCQLMMIVRGRPSLLTTVTSLGAELGTGDKYKMNQDYNCRYSVTLYVNAKFIVH